MEKYAVIMAGGVGSRFWPRSRKTLPKQLLNLFGEFSMIQETVNRLDGFIDADKIFVITNKVQKALIEEQLPQIPKDNIVAEPVGRNTAPCVALAAAVINEIKNDAVIITLPADHLIKDKKSFQQSLQTAAEFAFESKGLVTFGIQPTRPDTGYGYINFEKNETKPNVHVVKKFVEKPNLETAEQYLTSGEYLWNSGMFIWRADVVLDEIKQHLPEMYITLNSMCKNISAPNFYNELDEVYPGLESISIDYGLMEKSNKVFLLKSSFDWNDVGSWESAYELNTKDENMNANIGDVFTAGSINSYIYSPDKFTAVIGMDDVIVINTKDALLVCNRNNVQDVRKVVDHLTEEKREGLF
ncbi:MAG: mannose-1-phosphate guanylyltransferase/mannose-6-phosphate isomerase [Ignavibacteriaceae bacterium]|nr:mannose-1-phosphate guanylyltransferase/mannose-6-phosphate isomerase [Ignavibacteriaceae bacterium]